MASETYYVDELLKAEDEASKIIKNAEKERYGAERDDTLEHESWWDHFHANPDAGQCLYFRERKLKEAKAAAEAEIERFREKKEQEYKLMQERVNRFENAERRQGFRGQAEAWDTGRH